MSRLDRGWARLRKYRSTTWDRLIRCWIPSGASGERRKRGWELENSHGLSPLQQGLWVHTIYAPDAGEYVVQFSYRISGELETAALERAWQQVLARHQVLRSSYHWDEVAEPIQVVHQ